MEQAGSEYRAPNKCSLWVTLMVMESVASIALTHELVNSGVPKPQSLQEIRSCQCNVCGIHWESTTLSLYAFCCGILAANNKWLGCSISAFSLLGEIAVPFQLPGGVLWSYLPVISPSWLMMMILAHRDPPRGLFHVQLEPCPRTKHLQTL